MKAKLLNDVRDAVAMSAGSDRRTTVVFCSPLSKVTQRVRVTRRSAKVKRQRSIDLVVTIGPPNFREREFLKLCRKARTKPRRFWFPSK